MVISEILQPLQLEPLEEKTFLLLAEYGSMAASIIAKKLEVKRTTCYLLLERLVKKGIVERTIRKAIRYYQAIDLETLEKVINKQIVIFEEAKQKLLDHKQALKLLYRNHEENTEVMFYEGYDEIKKAYEKILDIEDKEIYSMMKKENTQDHEMHTFWQKYLKARISLKKKTFSIVNDEENSKVYVNEAKNEYREIKIVQKSDIELFGDLKVSGDLVAFISQHHGRIWGITIQDAQIAKFFKGIIKTLWKKL